jgi:hypothetical protein
VNHQIADGSGETNVFSARTLGPLALGERYALTFLKLFEVRALDSRAVEKNLPAGRHRDESKSLVRNLLDCTFGHVMLLLNRRVFPRMNA